MEGRVGRAFEPAKIRAPSRHCEFQICNPRGMVVAAFTTMDWSDQSQDRHTPSARWAHEACVATDSLASLPGCRRILSGLACGLGVFRMRLPAQVRRLPACAYRRKVWRWRFSRSTILGSFIENSRSNIDWLLAGTLQAAGRTGPRDQAASCMARSLAPPSPRALSASSVASSSASVALSSSAASPLPS